MAINSKGASSEWSDTLTVTISTSNPPLNTCLGGSSYDKANSIQQTADGGYILAGVTSSNDGDISGSNGLADAWVVKLDSNKAIQWQKCLPGLSNCNAFANSVRQTADGGYIVAGYIQTTYYSYICEAWVVKLSSSGNLQWQKYLQNPATIANSVQQTTDGGYIVAGGTGEQYVTGDLWVAKLASNGATEWQKSLGGSNSEIANSVQQTTDGGYILAGYTNSNDGSVSGNHGNEDSWVLKLSSTGALQWQKCLGGSQADEARCIQQTTDGGYILAGYTNSNDGDVSLNQGTEDFWVVKLGSDGAIQWQKCLGGSNSDIANSVQQTADGGYVVAGYANSMDGDASYNHGSDDFLVIKLNSQGVPIWNKCLGGSGDDEAYSVQQTSDEGYIVAGYTNSNDGDVSGNHGGYDFWVAKIEPENGPNNQPNKPFAPSGSPNGYVGTSYIYSTWATDPNGDKLNYTFYWDDDTTPSHTGLVDHGLSGTMSHIWAKAGTYNVKAMATNTKELSSEWSDSITVTIANPPILLVHGIFLPGLYENGDPYASLKDMAKWLTGTDKYTITDLYGMERFSNNGNVVYMSHYGVSYDDDHKLQPTLGDIKDYAQALSNEVYLIKIKEKVDKVDIVAHSMGGLVSRYYIERGGGYASVNKLIMLGTPNKGTETCNQDSPISKHYRDLGYTSDYTDIDEMTPENTFITKTLGELGRANYHIIAGTKNFNGFESWWKAAPLKDNGDYLTTKAGKNDGIVPYVRTELIDVPVPWSNDVNHYYLIKDNTVFDEVSALLEAIETTSIEPENGTSSFAEPRNNTDPLQMLPDINDKIYPNEEKLHNIDIGQVRDARIYLSGQEGNISLNLTTPSGKSINKSIVMSNINYTEFNQNSKAYSIDNPEAGVWKADVKAINVSAGGENYHIYTFINTSLALNISPPKYNFDPNEPIELKANLTNNSLPVTGAFVVAHFIKPDKLMENVSLYDDGLHNDSLANDGIYANTFKNSSLSGAYQIIVSANGTLNDQEFQRQDSTTVWAELYPDLAVSSSDISLSNPAPLPGENITLSAIIHNIDEGSANNASILFYDGSPESGTLIGKDAINVSAGNTTIAKTTWNTIPGQHQIYVWISPYNKFLETNYSNNEASLNISIDNPPFTPFTPSGSNEVSPGTTCSYSTSANDPDGDQIAYTFDWGDGTSSATGLIDTGTVISDSHSWSKNGTYSVRAKAADSKGASSGWSSSLIITINSPPNTPSIPSGPSSGQPGTSYSYSMSVNDPDGDLVQYTFNWGDGTPTSTTGLVSSGQNAGESHIWTKGGTYQVKAMATDSHGATSGWSSPMTVAINTPPNTPYVPIGLVSGTPGTANTYSTYATDPDGNQVSYTFDWGDANSSASGLVNSGTRVSETHGWSAAGIYQVKAMATDSTGASSGWSGYLAVTINTQNTPPDTPSIPFGPASGYVWSSYRYFTSANDPDGDRVKYTFDWGDGTNSSTELFDSGISANASHTWSKTGTFLVVAQTKDSKGTSSGWSNAIAVTVAANSLPNAPSKPTGSATGVAGSSYNYSTSATDPDGDQVKYTFDWGDGLTSTTALVNSGTSASASHAWSKAGTYLVKTNATDFNGAASGYSSTLTVTINSNKPPNAPSKPTGSATGVAGSSYSYSTSATDPDNDQVKYTFDWGDNTPQTTTGLVASGATASMPHSWSAAGTYQVKAMATDSKGATSGWSNTLAVSITGVNTNQVALQAAANNKYVSADNGGISPLIANRGSIGSWETFDLIDLGNNNVALRAHANNKYVSADNGGISPLIANRNAYAQWETFKLITSSSNRPPTTPSIPFYGPTTGMVGTSYSYSTMAKDADNDQVKYTFDWGDELTSTTALVNSGTSASASHAWSKAGTYLVKTNATDFKGAASGYSSTLTVKIGLTVSSGSDRVISISSLPGKKDLYEPLPGLNEAQERQGETDKAHADAVHKAQEQQSEAR